MDPTEQVAETAATGPQRGLYADIRTTFRAPMVNSIWRVLVAHDLPLAQYIWGQVKPAFQTREFAAFTIAFRDHVLSTIDPDRPKYDAAASGLDPTAYTELRGQLATFDIVAPRLAVFFYLMDRRLNDHPVGTAPASEAATAPFPVWLDHDRGHPPSMVPQSQARATLPNELAQSFGAMVPSIYRCIAQWPPYLEHADADITSILDSAPYADASTGAFALVETFLDRLPYTPRVDPDGLRGVGVAPETIEELRDLFGTFRRGGETILPLLHIYPATVGATGPRTALSFP